MDGSLTSHDLHRCGAPNDFIYRDARAEDRAEVLAFTAHTWDFGDYIGEVYDEWLADKVGRFVVVEEAGTGRIAAIDKLSFFAPGEAWFEGLRVNPEFRARGLGTRTQRYMIEEAARLGARTIRFLTLIVNHPIHIMAYRDGFRMRFVVRDWRGNTDTARDSNAEPEAKQITLRQATADEAPALFDRWQRGASYATCGLVHHNWQYGTSSVAEWQRAACEGHLFVSDAYEAAGAAFAPSLVLVRPNKYSEVGTSWTVAALAAPFGSTAALIEALKRKAAQAGISEIGGLFSDTVELYSGLEIAGMEPDPDDERLCLFELRLL